MRKRRKSRKNMARIRKLKGISQDKLAHKVNKSRVTIYTIEGGRMKNPTIETIQRIAEALGVTVTELLKK